LLLVLAASSCGTAMPKDHADAEPPKDAALVTDAGGTSATDAGPTVEAGADVAASADAGPQPQPVAFSLRNETGKRIYIQSSGFSGQAYWQLSRDGMRLPANNTCEVCDCSETGCSVCGRGIAQVTAIEPGQSHPWQWDGRIWVRKEGLKGSGIPCEQDEAVLPGMLTVQVTYSFTSRVDTQFGADDVFIGDPVGAQQMFIHPPPGPVEIVVR